MATPVPRTSKNHFRSSSRIPSREPRGAPSKVAFSQKFHSASFKQVLPDNCVSKKIIPWVSHGRKCSYENLSRNTGGFFYEFRGFRSYIFQGFFSETFSNSSWFFLVFHLVPCELFQVFLWKFQQKFHCEFSQGFIWTLFRALHFGESCIGFSENSSSSLFLIQSIFPLGMLPEVPLKSLTGVVLSIFQDSNWKFSPEFLQEFFHMCLQKFFLLEDHVPPRVPFNYCKFSQEFLQELLQESFPCHHSSRHFSTFFQEIYQKFTCELIQKLGSEILKKKKRFLNFMHKSVGFYIFFPNF